MRYAASPWLLIPFLSKYNNLYKKQHLLHQSQNPFVFPLFPWRFLLHRIPELHRGTRPRQGHGTFPLSGRCLSRNLPSLRRLLRQRNLISDSNESEVVLYYGECMLRYSYRNILSTAIYNEGGVIRLNNNVSSNQEDRFEDLVSTTMNKAADKAANSCRKFYTIKANWTALQSLYGLVQCTPDLTRYDCLRCLHQSIDGIPLNRIGGRLFWPSCNARYELYLFFNENDTRTPPEQHAPSPPQPSPLPPPPASTSPVSSLTRTGELFYLHLCITMVSQNIQYYPVSRKCFFF